MKKDKIVLKNNIIDLAQPRLGTKVIYCTDDFFAKSSRIINPEPPIFLEGKFDKNGKWMDGWESRRKRTIGNDYLILKLGRPGKIKQILVDTAFFSGNQPEKFSLLGMKEENLKKGKWITLVKPTKAKPNSKHFFKISNKSTFKYIKLNIFPDGGIARLRVLGQIDTNQIDIKKNKIVNLSALEYGASIYACNNEHFGKVENILAPGKAKNMGDGWETRRRRNKGYDWVIIKCIEGKPKFFEISTHHFKGNYPHQFSLQASMIQQDKKKDIHNNKNWICLLNKKFLKPHKVHKFKINQNKKVNYLKLSIFPDGGVSRIKVMGTHL